MSAYFVAYLSLFCTRLCISIAWLSIQMHIYMHIPVLQVRLGLSWSIPVPLHSNSFISTGLPVNTFICAGQANPAPTSAPGREGAGACSSWPIVRWPVNRLSLHLHQYENLIGQDVNRVGRYSNCSFCSSSSSSSWVHSSQPHFPSCCQLRTPACSFHVVSFVENPFQSTSPSWEIPLPWVYHENI